MVATMAISWAWLLGAVPLLLLAFWHATDAWYSLIFFLRHGKEKSLPPGHMGVPFLGETLSLIWYFKHARRPDDFIGAKMTAYGKAAGMYRTHLFGSRTIVACTPAANKFVLQSPENFSVQWPEPELVGHASVVNVEGASHARLRGFILAAINSPKSLRTIAAVLQPRVVAALASWADMGTIVAATEIKKVS
jgi:ent-kaurenoic acid hydroxylase